MNTIPEEMNEEDFQPSVHASHQAPSPLSQGGSEISYSESAALSKGELMKEPEEDQ
jgi:hypothetical protein